ncbi:MAG: sulfatase-like hydrolase/transferase [Planctomycetota bacterium]|nr:sulfatase-like hydrolase/transferase [Planctomycetota bacterium]
MIATLLLALAASAAAPQAVPTPQNVLVILADDVGCDMVGLFSGHPDAPPTPNIDALAAAGVAFQAAYTDPICSPTRACVLTGRYSFRTGIGNYLAPNPILEHSLQPGEVTIPEALASVAPWPFDTSAIGKWHLTALPQSIALGPNQQGFAWFEGVAGNLYLGQNFYSYTEIRNGVASPETTYATTEQVDDALARVAVMREPWFLYLATSAGHQPWHVPPPALHTYNLSGLPDATPAEHYRASVQALDSELGRLLAGIDPVVLARTTVILMGDNGSPNEVVTPPSISGKCKGTLFEGGVRVPLIIAGPQVAFPGSQCYSLVNSVDLFPTVLDLCGVPPSAQATLRPHDGVSLTPYLAAPWRAPLRSWVFATKFLPNGFGPYTSMGRMMRTSRWKLIRRDGQSDLFFDMASAQGENLNLAGAPMGLTERAAYARLARQLDELVR